MGVEGVGLLAAVEELWVEVSSWVVKIVGLRVAVVKQSRVDALRAQKGSWSTYRFGILTGYDIWPQIHYVIYLVLKVVPKCPRNYTLDENLMVLVWWYLEPNRVWFIGFLRYVLS